MAFVFIVFLFFFWLFWTAAKNTNEEEAEEWL